MRLKVGMCQGSRLLAAMLLAAASPANGLGEAGGSLRPWNEYRTIMWVGDTARKQPEKLPLFFQRLREMGVNTAMIYGTEDPAPTVKAAFPYYVENLVNRGLCLKFNSSVTDWDKTVTDWARKGRPGSALVRDYCLDDPAWMDSARTTLTGIVAKNATHHPLAYNIRDELSVTISANPFDYDFNDLTLDAFRSWLRTQYVSLEELNKEWGTEFKDWAAVKPFTTDQIKNRRASGQATPHGQPDWQQLQRVEFDPVKARQNPTAWNFAPWADFRSYMDLSLAKALDKLRMAARVVDPATPVGIEGTQMPAAFGGYDLWRLSQVLDWVEPYDIGCAREILGSFMPGKPILATVFESETRPAQRRLWHLLLEGDRGCLVWWSEDCLDWANGGWPLTKKALALAPVLADMTSPLAGLFLRARHVEDPVFIHYSQASIQTDWLIESTVDGSTWLRRFSSFEAEHNRMARTREAWLKALQDLGYAPRFISSEQIESGGLAGVSNAVLVLPESYSLSDRESLELGRMANSISANWRILADGPAGCFDGHARLRVAVTPGALSSLATNNGTMVLSPNGKWSQTPERGRAYLEQRLMENPRSDWLDWLRGQLKFPGAGPPDIVVPSTARARIHRFTVPSGALVGIERNIDYHMSEDLKQAGGNQALETSISTQAVLRQPAHVYDLREQKYLGFTNQILFNLDPWQPTLLALLNRRVPEKSIVSELEAELNAAARSAP